MNGKARLADSARKTLKSLPRLVATLGCAGLLIGGLGVIAMQGLALVLDNDTQKRVVHIFIADLNDDGHQDVFMVTNQMHSIAFNDGTGRFKSSKELFMRKYALALGDLNGNGQLDAILTKFENGEMGGDLILECGEMSSDYIFPVSTVDIPHQVFAVRDGNRDGVPEDFVAGCCGGGPTMMNYAFLPSDRRPCLGSDPPAAGALGDLNGDGSLDVFHAKGWMLVNGEPQSTT
ncbi:MAG: VCBS repeat-containing protein, partial [Anaerolineae bacterium]|nr:VCBS repeat-containing protein [Anaerolineae bacterium]